MTFAQKLKTHRARLALTKIQTAALLDVSPRAYAYWEIDREPLAVTQEGALARLAITQNAARTRLAALKTPPSK